MNNFTHIGNTPVEEIIKDLIAVVGYEGVTEQDVELYREVLEHWACSGMADIDGLIDSIRERITDDTGTINAMLWYLIGIEHREGRIGQ